MKAMKYFIVDAFTDELFKGNPAGVCLPDVWPGDEVMQNIAFENNFSETAFVVKNKDHYDLRWFTPEVEIDLCGHATLASAFVISNFVDTEARVLRFATMSGILTVTRTEDIYEMYFHARKPVRIEATEQMSLAIGAPVLEAYKSRDHLLLLEDECQVRDLTPDFELLKKLPDCFAVIVTARGDKTDFVSRFFGPGAGVPEDPVTGSAHSTLIPFWAERLGKDKLTAMQLSRRGGTLYCENLGDRVKIAGRAALYLKGEIFIDA